MYCHQVKHTLARGWQPLRTRELGRQVADAVLAADHVGLLFLASGFQRRGLGGAVGQAPRAARAAATAARAAPSSAASLAASFCLEPSALRCSASCFARCLARVSACFASASALVCGKGRGKGLVRLQVDSFCRLQGGEFGG